MVTLDALPTTPTDGLLVMLTSSRKLYQYAAATDSWALMADYSAYEADIAELQAGTIENADFTALMDSATALIAVADQKDLLDNLAATMGFDTSGLTITSVGGLFYMVLGVQSLDFRKKTDTGYVTVTTFGNIRTITSPTLQIGQTGQTAKLEMGGLAIQALTNGDVEFRVR